MAECFVDSDCPGVQLCYQNTTVSWLENGINRCFCNTEYGWEGADCSVFGPSTYYIATSTGLYTCVALLEALFAIYVALALAVNKKFKCNGLSFTLVLVLIETVTIAARGSVVLTILHSPERQTTALTIQGDRIEKAHDLILFIRVLVSLNIVFGFLAGLHVSLVWLQIVSQSQKLAVKNKGALATYPKVVFGIEGLMVLLLIILGSIGSFGLMGIAVLPFLIGTMVLYTVGLAKLRSLLGSSDGAPKSTATSYSTTLSYIQQCYFGVLFSVILIISGAVGVGVLAVRGYKEANPAGQISTFVVLNEVTPWGLCLMMASVLLYVYRFVRKDMGSSRQFSRKRSKLSGTSKQPLGTTQMHSDRKIVSASDEKKSESYSV